MINNNYLKLLSVFIAVFLWVMVVMGQIETESMSVPVKLINAPKGYVAVASVPSVSVTVKGAAKVLKNMGYSSIILNMDVNSLPAGDTSRRILPQDFKTPLGIEVVEVVPKELNITIDQIGKKSVRVVPTFIGDAGHGFKVESVSTKPNSVEIEGARSKLKAISSVATLPVNISGIKDSTVFNIGFRAEEGVKNIKPETVEVRIKMRPDIVRKDLKGIPVSCMDLKSGLSMKSNPKLTSVIVSGRSDLVDMFPAVSSFVVNCANITKPGKYFGTVAYKSDIDGVEVLSITPQKINFEIR